MSGLVCVSGDYGQELCGHVWGAGRVWTVSWVVLNLAVGVDIQKQASAKCVQVTIQGVGLPVICALLCSLLLA